MHGFHRLDIEVVNVLYSKAKVTTREMISLCSTVTRAFSVLHLSQALHYVVAEIRPSNKEVFIFNGFCCALRHWLCGVTKALIQCNLLSGESNITVIKKTEYYDNYKTRQNVDGIWTNCFHQAT